MPRPDHAGNEGQGHEDDRRDECDWPQRRGEHEQQHHGQHHLDHLTKDTLPDHGADPPSHPVHVVAVAHGAVDVTEDAAGQDGVEELGAVVRGDGGG